MVFDVKSYIEVNKYSKSALILFQSLVILPAAWIVAWLVDLHF